MVKLTEVEDEHFTDKPVPSKNDALLVSDDEEDYTDTGKCLTDSRFLNPFSPFRCANLSHLDFRINSCPRRTILRRRARNHIPQTRPAQNHVSAKTHYT